MPLTTLHPTSSPEESATGIPSLEEKSLAQPQHHWSCCRIPCIVSQLELASAAGDGKATLQVKGVEASLWSDLLKACMRQYPFKMQFPIH